MGLAGDPHAFVAVPLASLAFLAIIVIARILTTREPSADAAEPGSRSASNKRGQRTRRGRRTSCTTRGLRR